MDIEHLWRAMVNLVLLWALGTHHMREAHNPGKGAWEEGVRPGHEQ